MTTSTSASRFGTAPRDHDGNLFIGAAIVAAVVLFGAPARGGGVTLSGFIDYRYEDAANAEGGFSLRPGNGVELDLAADLTEVASVEAAFASGGDALAVGAAFFDLHFKPPPGHTVHGWKVKEGGIQLGLFDAPFGIESRTYASADRPSIAAPFLTSRLMNGGWTDVGANLYFSNTCPDPDKLCPGPYQVNLFALDGFLWDDGADGTFGTPDDLGLSLPLAASSNGKTYGGRLGCQVTDALELGVSYARGAYRANVPNADPLMSLAGFDATYNRDRFSLRGEYVRFTGDNPGAADQNIRTWYIEPVYAVTDRIDVYARYDEIRYDFDRDGDALINDDVRSMLGGVRFRLTENVAFRCEVEGFQYKKTVPAKDNAVRASVVAVF